MGKSGGKSSGKGGKGKGKAASALRAAAPEKSVFLSGLPEGIAKGTELDKMNLELKKHLSQGGIKCQAAEIWKNGNGSACFATAKDVETAMETLNGTEFKDTLLAIDVWTSKTKDA